MLERFDLYFLKLINVQWADPVLDQFWLTITQLHKQVWFAWGVAPILLLALVYIYRRGALQILLAAGLAVGVADTIAYRGVKAVVDRQRPFQNAELSWVRKVGIAHGKSFPSNHAANVFALAGILAWYFPRGRYGFYTLALLVAVSRVALGVHYPSDVIAGAAIGYFVAFAIRFFILNHYGHRAEFLRLSSSSQRSLRL